jgi:hypothetical protein
MIKTYATNNRVLLISFYTVLAFGIIIWWAIKFWKTISSTDQDFLFFAGSLFVVTIVFYVFVFSTFGRRRILLSILLPCLTIISSLIIGLICLMLLSMRGTPLEMICVYGTVYYVSSIVLSVYFRNRFRTK